MKNLFGIIPPATTAFDRDGRLDEDSVVQQLQWLKAKGSHGVAVGGSTGEGHTLSRDEFKILLKLARECLGTAFPLVAGIIVNSTDEAIERGKIARDQGADVLQVPRCIIFLNQTMKRWSSTFGKFVIRPECPC